MSPDFDRWLEHDQSDVTYCEDHDRAKPCTICKAEAVEAQLERAREERKNAH